MKTYGMKFLPTTTTKTQKNKKTRENHNYTYFRNRNLVLDIIVPAKGLKEL